VVKYRIDHFDCSCLFRHPPDDNFAAHAADYNSEPCPPAGGVHRLSMALRQSDLLTWRQRPDFFCYAHALFLAPFDSFLFAPPKRGFVVIV
jgi:hypothetical protein